MTDTRLPEQWLGDPMLDDLSDAAHRVFVNGLVWSVKYGRDGVLLKTALRLLHPEGVPPEVVEELLAAGLWRRHGERDFEIVDFLKFQTPAAKVEEQREQNRQRQAAYRAEQAKAGTKVPKKEVTRDVTRDVTGDVGQAQAQASETQPPTKVGRAREPERGHARTREADPAESADSLAARLLVARANAEALRFDQAPTHGLAG